MAEISRRAVLGGVLGGLAAGALPAAPAVAAGDWLDDQMSSPRAWASFLAGADLIWKKLPEIWFDGPFLGNGFLGSGIYREPGANALRFNVQHTEVQDHRPEFGSLFGLARLPIGHLTLEPVGAITAVDWRLDVWNAELRGTITTAAGSLVLRAFVHMRRSVLVVEVTPSEGERGFRWVFHPDEAISPRANPIFGRTPPAGYTGNPPRRHRAHQPTAARRWRARHRVVRGDPRLATHPLRRGGLVPAGGHRAGGRDPDRSHRFERATLRTGGQPCGVVACVLPQELPVHPGRPPAELLLDPALQAGLGRAGGRARHGHLRTMARVNAVAGDLVEPQRAAGVLADPRLKPPRARRRHPIAGRKPPAAHRPGRRAVPRRLRRHPAYHGHVPASSSTSGTSAHARRRRRVACAGGCR